MAYGLDMRERAMELVDEGRSYCETGEMLGVSWWTVSNWHKRHKDGRLAAEYPTQRGSYTINDDALVKHLEEHPDAYAKELAEVAGGTAQGIRDACKRLGITRKKRHHNTGSVMKKSGQLTLKS